MSQATGYFVRDTLIEYELLKRLPPERQEQIQALTTEYKRLGYIDVRTQLGPDQVRRMSDKQRNKITSTACRVFDIEGQIKQLLKTDAQLHEEATKEAIQSINYRIQRIKYRIRDIENYCSRKLNSPRQNPTKTEYAELKTELETLTAN